MNERTKQITTLAMLCALAYIATAVFRIPLVLFLKYDPKDIIITIAGFIYGPLPAVIVALLVAFVEMLTLSSTGPWGMNMNVISSSAFACTAAYIYKKHRTIRGAIAGLVAGVTLMVIKMMLWTYIVSPIYMGMPREAVAAMLLPYFLPFNLIKGGLNATITMLLYKPIVQTLRRDNLVPGSGKKPLGKRNIGLILVALLVLATCILVGMSFQGII